MPVAVALAVAAAAAALAGGARAVRLLADTTTPDGVAYARAAALLPELSLYWSIDFDERTLRMALAGETEGWVGLGIGEPTSGSMPGADTVVGWVVGGVVVGLDSFTTDFVEPSIDPCQDVEVLSGEERDGVTTLHVSRPLDVAEGNHDDRPIPPGPVSVIFAFGDVDGFVYHGANRGLSRLEFYSLGDEELGGELRTAEDDPYLSIDPAPPEEIKHFEARFNDVPIGDDDTVYLCQVFDIPVDRQVHLVDFEFVSAGAPREFVHHFIVYACKDFEFDEDPFTCRGVGARSCLATIAAWGPGIGKIEFPRHAGYRVGPRRGTDEEEAPTHLLLEMHYDNPERVPGIRDSSGVRVGFVNELRRNDVGVLVLGDSTNTFADIQPGHKTVSYESECPSACTSSWDHPINIFADVQHMHAAGQSMLSTLHPGGEYHPNTPPLNAVQFFAFGLQQMTPMERTMYPGDSINTHCQYDTSGYTRPIRFADGSEDEMCLEYLFYYPKLKNIEYCGNGAEERGGARRTICGQDNYDFMQLRNPVSPDPDDIFDRTFLFGTGCSDVVAAPSPSAELDASPTEGAAVDDAASATAAPEELQASDASILEQGERPNGNDNDSNIIAQAGDAESGAGVSASALWVWGIVVLGIL